MSYSLCGLITVVLLLQPIMFIFGTIMLCCYYNVTLLTLSCMDCSLNFLHKVAFPLSDCIASVSCISSIKLYGSCKAILAITCCQCKAVVPLSGYTAHHGAMDIMKLRCLYIAILLLCNFTTLIKLYCLYQAVLAIAVSLF